MSYPLPLSILPTLQALDRIEQILTGAYLTDDDDQADRWIDWAVAIGEEWNLPTELFNNTAIAARDNANEGRDLGFSDYGDWR